MIHEFCEIASTMIHVYSHAIYRVKLFWSIPFLCEVCNQLYICIIVCKYIYFWDFIRIYLLRALPHMIEYTFNIVLFSSSLRNIRIKKYKRQTLSQNKSVSHMWNNILSHFCMLTYIILPLAIIVFILKLKHKLCSICLFMPEWVKYEQ